MSTQAAFTLTPSVATVSRVREAQGGRIDVVAGPDGSVRWWQR